jgi:transposase-like protein
MANIHRTPEQWQQIFKQHVSSGLQIAAFCKQQKLNPSSFYAWRKRLANHSLSPTITDNDHNTDKNQPDWVSITPEQMPPSSCWDIELALPNGVILRMMNN